MKLICVYNADQGLFKEFVESFGRADIALPVILRERDGELQTLVSADEIDSCESLQALIEKVRAAVTAHLSK